MNIKVTSGVIYTQNVLEFHQQKTIEEEKRGNYIYIYTSIWIPNHEERKSPSQFHDANTNVSRFTKKNNNCFNFLLSLVTKRGRISTILDLVNFLHKRTLAY